MESVGDIEHAEATVLADVTRLLDDLRALVANAPATAARGVALLSEIREAAYEDLNQIHHEYLILCAIRWLVKCDPRLGDAEWRWNPRQTGNASEPDLQGLLNAATCISAEITTSRRPIGTIRDRMRATLLKLNGFVGDRFYFVRTDQMLRAADTIIAASGLRIKAVCIPHST